VETFQISDEAAEFYEARFVPAIFAGWAERLVDEAGVGPGISVLDVACGTGIVARRAWDRMDGRGTVTGLDLNEAMLTVARRVGPGIEWRQGDAADLPFADGSFDVVLCQAALMFLPDRTGALAEMRRVLAPGGTVAVAVPGRLEASTAYARFVDVAVRHAGPEARELLSSYFALGDLDHLRSLFEAAGLPVRATSSRAGIAAFASADDFVATEISASPLGERITPEIYDLIRDDMRTALEPFVTTHGLAAPLEVHLVVAGR
jgi:ubiquinone/menaquinone biosynthesis C-methylase UbiE